ncbi:MAG TPA: hypothetical protein VGA36_10300 [Nitriliruptorales bacterium]
MAVLVATLCLTAVACSSRGSADPLGAPAFELPPAQTNAVVFVEGSDRERPAQAVVVVAPDGTVEHRVAVNERLIRLRETASPAHVILLSRTEGATSTAVEVLDVTTGEVTALELPAGDWEAVRLLGTPRVAPGSLTVLADQANRLVAVVDLTSLAVHVIDDVPDADAPADPEAAPPALRMGPTGDAAVLTMPDGARVIGIEGGSRRLSGPADDFTFVRWLGNGRALEYVRTTPGSEPVLTAELVGGGEPEQVSIGQVDAALPTPRGLVIVRDRTLWLVGRDGPSELATGDGPFVLPVAASGSGGHLLVFDGAGGGFENVLVATTDGTTTTVDLPAGSSPSPGTIGADVVWLASGDGQGPVLTLDLSAGTVEDVFDPPTDQPVNPTLLQAAPDGRHAVARVGTSLTALALRAMLLSADGSAPVELAQGRNADAEFSPDGRYVAVTWDPVDNPIDRLARLAIFDTTTHELTDLGPAHEAIWVGA